MAKSNKQEQDILILQSKCPEGIDLTTVNFKYPKNKENLLEIEAALLKHGVNFKDKI